MPVQRLTRPNWLLLVCSGLATGRLSWLFCFRAPQLGRVSPVGPVDKLSVALTLLLAVVLTLLLGGGAGREAHLADGPGGRAYHRRYHRAHSRGEELAGGLAGAAPARS